MSKIKDMKLRHKVGVGVVTGTAILGMAGGAFAYLSETSHVSATGGNGTVTPSSGTVSNITWSAGTATGLVPGGSPVNVTITLTNSNPYTVNIGAWTFAVSGAPNPTVTGCTSNTVADLSGTFTTLSNFEVAKGSTTTVTVPVSMGDLPGTDQSTCVSGGPLAVSFSATDANSSDTNV